VIRKNAQVCGRLAAHLVRASVVELPRRRTLFRRIWPAERTEHTIQRRVADAEPVFLADEVMAQMVLLDPVTEPRAIYIETT
jgi:hypothetical protein